MREAIRTKLTTITDVGDRVFEPHAAGADTQKPYIVISQGPDSKESAWAGFRRDIEIWPNVARTSFVSVDALAKKVVDTLAAGALTTAGGDVFTCIYQGVVGDDVVHEDWDIITRGLRFAVLALQPVVVTDTVADDPWAAALASWSSTLLGATWTVYKNKWPLGYKKPAVMWRVANVETQNLNRAAYKETKTLICHVLGDTPNREVTGVETVTAGLLAAFKIVLEQKNRRYLTVEDAKGSYQANALTAGQVTAVLSRVIMRQFTQAPLMQEVAFKLKERIGD
jgi:hypothetical protein